MGLVLAVDLKEAGIQLQHVKPQGYIATEFRNAEWDELQGDSDSEVVTVDGNTLHNITTCNVPIGDKGFAKGYLEQKTNKITRAFGKITELLDPDRLLHLEIPSHKMLSIWTIICFHFMGDQWLRHVRPNCTEQFSKEIDDSIISLFQTCVEINIDDQMDFERENVYAYPREVMQLERSN